MKKMYKVTVNLRIDKDLSVERCIMESVNVAIFIGSLGKITYYELIQTIGSEKGKFNAILMIYWKASGTNSRKLINALRKQEKYNIDVRKLEL